MTLELFVAGFRFGVSIFGIVMKQRKEYIK